MASSRSRQRALARAKTERQIARRAAAARRRRQWQAGIGGALVLALAVVGAIWATGGFEPDPVKPDDCAWTPQDLTANANLRDVGRPPTKGIPKSGVKTMTITTNQGVITAILDLAKAPCTAASMSYLAGKDLFKDSKCYRLTGAALYCGDPSGSGSGGPTYNFPSENLPAADQNPTAPTDPSAPAPSMATYSRGVLAMDNAGPDTNGSRFFIVYKDTQLPPNYTIFGTVVSGLEAVEKVAAGGDSGDPAGDGPPKTETIVQSVTVTDQAPEPTPAATSSEPAPSTSASPVPSATASTNP